MTALLTRPQVEFAESVDAAVHRLTELGPDGAALAGGTWLMRAAAPPPVLVALHRIPELRGPLGALATHTEVGARPLPPAHRALGRAARLSAFPQVRNVATLGGNLSARGFAQADLVPALLALDATVEIATPHGRRTLGVDTYVRDPHGLLVAATAPTPADRRSGYARLTVRGGGEYALVSVAVSAAVDPVGVASQVRVAVGSVESRARRVPEAEAVLAGTALDDDAVHAAGEAAAAALTAHDDVFAPGWYRLRVLPTVLARAVADLRGAL